ncbi:MAG: RNA polymerase sigma factor [Microthrixaceae bacterium]
MSDAEAFSREVWPRLYRNVALYCGDDAVAEEVAQEALARAWERWPTVAAAESPTAWVHRVAFNLATSHFRRRATERRARKRIAPTTPLDGPDATALVVRAAVATLPKRQRAALVLRYFDDLSVEDTAAAMGCAPGTVKSLTHQAIDALRGRIELVTDQEPDHV